MDKNKVIKIYLIITFLPVSVVCSIILILNQFGVQIYNTPVGLLAIVIGGLSSAFSGAVLAKKSKKILNYKQLIKDFFNLRQPVLYYIGIVLFLLLLFGTRILNSEMQEGQNWFNFPVFFFVAILFGGVEEIGWRYLFQPILEEKISFWMSSIITFLFWGIWHVIYFVIDGSFLQMNSVNIMLFLCGLFGTSFVLGAIFYITKSLWLCVMYHALLNAFTQLFIATKPATTILIMIGSIAFSVFGVAIFKQKSQR